MEKNVIGVPLLNTESINPFEAIVASVECKH